MPDTTLTTAQVTFQTGLDNKMENSVIEVLVRDAGDSIVARASDSYGEFKNFTTNGPYPLEILNQAPRTTLKPGGSVLLNYTPRSTDPLGNDGDNDDWNFNVFIDLVFSDASHLAVAEDNLKLGAKKTQASFGL